MNAVLIGIFFFLPALTANAAAMLAGLAALRGQPIMLTIDDILTAGRVELFGKHKTILGCLLMVLAALVAGENIWGIHRHFGLLPKVFLPNDSWQDAMGTSLLLGAGACLGDLLGSFLKRRLGIPSGKDLWVIDQVDWFFGAVALLLLFNRLPSRETVVWGAGVLLTARCLTEIPRQKIFSHSQPRQRRG